MAGAYRLGERLLICKKNLRFGRLLWQKKQRRYIYAKNVEMNILLGREGAIIVALGIQ